MNASDPKPTLTRADRRRASRQQVLKLGKLIFGGFSPTVVDCLVLEESEDGARVETAVMTNVPEILLLQIDGNVARRVRRCWATGNEIGLEFLPDADEPG